MIEKRPQKSIIKTSLVYKDNIWAKNKNRYCKLLALEFKTYRFSHETMYDAVLVNK